MKGKLKAMLGVLLVMILSFSIQRVLAYEGIDYEVVDDNSGRNYVVSCTSFYLKYMTTNSKVYALSFKKMHDINGVEAGEWVVYCMDHGLGSPKESWTYNPWGGYSNEVTYCLQHGYPYVDFFEGQDVDEKDYKNYYITNCALNILAGDKMGFHSDGTEFLSNAQALEIENGEMPADGDPYGLRDKIMQLVYDSRNNARGAYIETGKITSLTKDGDYYITNRITVNADSALESYVVNVNNGCIVENQTNDGFNLKIPASVVEGNLESVVKSTTVKGFFPGGKSVLMGGIWGQQNVATLQDEYKECNLDIETIRIQINKSLISTLGNNGDATVENAVYGVFTDEACTNQVETLTTDSTGTTGVSKFLVKQPYYVKEIDAPTGTVKNEKVYYIDSNSYSANSTVTLSVENNVIENSIEITKYIGETSNSVKAPLQGAEFTATLISSKGTDNEYSVKCSAPTDENGYCIIENLPYGKYEIEETTVPDNTLKCSNFTLSIEKSEEQLGRKYNLTDVKFVDEKNKLDDVEKAWLDSNGYLVDEPKVIQIKIRKVDKDGWEGKEKVDFTQGDAVLKGAIYEIYEYDETTKGYTKHLYDITVDHKDDDGYWCAESDDLIVGRKYMVKEKIKSTETVDDKTYNYSYAEGYLVDEQEYYFEQESQTQTTKRTYQNAVSQEEITRGSLKVIKYNNNPDSTEEAESKGAILRLTLKSNPDIWYEVTLDENGYGEFIDRNDDTHTTSVKTCYGDKYYPYTIPYGEYELTETQESNPKEHTHFYTQAETVTITKNTQKEYRILSDEPVPAWLKIVKKDKDTGKTVKLEGAKFKIWDVTNSKWVELMKTPSGEMISEFETNSEGYFYTPQELQPGEYVIYETQAPKGYYLEDDLRVPENTADLGNTDISGQKVVINKVTTGLKDDTEYPEGGITTGELVVEVEMKDTPLKVDFTISKTGEKLTGATATTVEYQVSEVEEVEEEKYTPKYTTVGLEGVGYKIYAVADTYTPDGIKRYDKDELVADITTNSEGVATAKELYPGEYRIVEYKTPNGYLKDDNIPNVTLVNEDQYVKVAQSKKDLSDIRQKLQLTFEKTFEDINFANSENPEQKALFGVYTKNAIMDYKGNNIVIPANKLVDLIWTDENNDVTSQIDLPEGTYVVRELYVTYPYTKSIDEQTFELKYSGDSTQPYVVKEGKKVNNDYEKASITLIKLSSAIMDNIVLNGNKLDTTELDSKTNEIINAIKGKTLDEIKEYFKENEISCVPNAEYTVYTDEACTKALMLKNETTGKFETAKLITNDSGVIQLDNVPLGEYWIQETKAPKGYALSEEKVKITLDQTTKNTMVYQALIEDDVVEPFLTKIDIFTGEPIANCTFEIKDKETGEVLLHSVTNEEGKAFIPISLFENDKKYTYTEISAPDIYDLNTKPHEFTAKFDEEGNWAVKQEKVENRRKTSTVELTKLDFADSTVIPNCKFELRSLETDYVVTGVTDKNGIYVFENVPYGKYTYTELEAPEEYLIDTTPHEIEINAEEMKIQITNEKVPDTSDIAVYALIGVAIISAIGIIYTVRKNTVKSK